MAPVQILEAHLLESIGTIYRTTEKGASQNIIKGSNSEPDPLGDSTDGHMFDLFSKEILSSDIKESILSTEQIGMNAHVRFIEDRLTSNDSLWNTMTKVKPMSCIASANEMKLKVGSEVLTQEETSSLVAMTLMIAAIFKRGN